jgi:hypothetical protein
MTTSGTIRYLISIDLLNVGGGNQSVCNHTTRAGAVRVRARESASGRVLVRDRGEAAANGGRGRASEVGAEEGGGAIGADVVSGDGGKRLALSVRGRDGGALAGVRAHNTSTLGMDAKLALGDVLLDVNLHGSDADLELVLRDKSALEVGRHSLEGVNRGEGEGTSTKSREVVEISDCKVFSRCYM